MANFYFGLNANKNFSEIQSKVQALSNLGLNIKDLDKIRGISNVGVSAADIKSLANLQEDARRALGALRADANVWDNFTRNFKTIRDIVKTNVILEEGQLKAQAVKYRFYDYGSDTIKNADISTSRVSAWSQFPGETEIFYGGQLEVSPAHASNPDAGRSLITFDSLQLKSAPTPKRFASEVPTHTIRLSINGDDKEVYVMKGIPLVFNGFFKTIDVKYEIDQTISPNISPTILVKGVEEGDEDIRQDQALTETSLRFYDYRYREKDIELYYRPEGFKKITITSANIREFPNVDLPNLKYLNLSFNDFVELPDFSVLTPTLTELHMTGNDLNRGTLTSAQQVLTLPTSLTQLRIQGTYTDRQNLDLTHLTNLTHLYFSEYASQYVRRRILSTNSPAVANSVVYYDVYNQGHTKLHSTVCDLPSLNTIQINWNDITRDSDDNPLVMKSALGVGEVETRAPGVNVTGTGTLVNFYSASNSHNILDVRQNKSIRYYGHAYSRGLYDPTGLPNITNDIAGKFTGCDNLSTISFYATDVRGDLITSFQGLTKLSWFDVRYTLMHGQLNSSSTIGSENLNWLLVAGSYFGRDGIGGAEIPYEQVEVQVETPPDSGIFVPELQDTTWQFFNEKNGRIFERCPNFGYLYAYSNRSIKGTLPDLSRNYFMRVLYTPYTNLSTGLNNLASLPRLYYINIDSCRFTQMPRMTTSALQYFYAQGNLFEGILEEFDTPILRFFFAFNNSFTGSIPNFGKSQSLERLLLQNNQFQGYTPGALSTNLRLNRLDLSNNSLTPSAISQLIDDLETNYAANVRRGVSINLLGNGVTVGDLPEATVTKIGNLINNGWSVSI